MSELVESLIRRGAELKSQRSSWEAHWQDVIDYVIPRKGSLGGFNTPGAKRTDKVFDGTAMHALDLLASGLHGLLTNPATAWFALRLRDRRLMEAPGVRFWLEEVEQAILAELALSNFDTAVHEFYLDAASIATAVLYVEEGDDAPLTFSTRAVGEVCIAENRDGNVDTVFREFTWTTRQCLQTWGEKCSPRLAAGRPDQGHAVLHAVFPRLERDRSKEDARNMPYASVYLEVEERHLLEEGGYQEFPFMAARWSKVSGEVYGRGPAMSVLPDIKMLNRMAQTIIRGAQKAVDPPLMLPDDGYLGPVKTTPSGINYYRSGAQEIRSLPTGQGLPFGLELMRDIQARIRSAFYVDQLQLREGPQMTATEVLRRTEEKLRIMGPILGRLKSEFLQPLIARVYGLLARAGKLPPPPPDLVGAEYDVQYISPIAKAQRQSEAGGALRTLEAVTPLARTEPRVLDNFDFDRWARGLAELYGTPQSWLREEDQVKKLRAERDRAAAEAGRQSGMSGDIDTPGRAADTENQTPALGQILAEAGL